ncbi:MAG: cellulose synthase subunit BcsC-related outer membrane protein, partial [Steroidobacteraceae bacterium]
YDEPHFDGGRSSGTSLSAYAAVERQISRAFVLGAKLDIDRADYYEPTVFMLYARHVFGTRATQLAAPPRPVRSYAEQR